MRSTFYSKGIDRLVISIRKPVGCVSNGVAFVSVSQQFDISTPTGKMMLGTLATFAQFERETTRGRIKDNFQNPLRNGGWIGGSIENFPGQMARCGCSTCGHPCF